MTRRNTFVNALVGAAVTVVTAAIPFSPLLGGAVAGYLQRGDLRDGATVGALAGVLTTAPLALLATLVGGFFVIAPDPGPPVGVLPVFFVVAFLLVGLYAVTFGLIGGVIGAYLAAEFRGRRPPRGGRRVETERRANREPAGRDESTAVGRDESTAVSDDEEVR